MLIFKVDAALLNEEWLLKNLISNTMVCTERDEDQHASSIKTNELTRHDGLFLDFFK